MLNRLCYIICLLCIHLSINGQTQRCSTPSPETYSINSDNATINLRSEIIIPLVFHVIYNTEDENISDAQIKSQIDILNQEFAGTVRNNNAIAKEFAQLRGFANLRFCLASIDPDNLTTTGITRTPTNINFIADAGAPSGRQAIFYDQYGGHNGWPADQYINIWVGQSDFFGGKSSFPDDVTFPEEEGIILDPNFTGSIGSARLNTPFNLGKTLIHELGHYFNLKHIWGSGSGGDCSVDDGISDTPLQNLPHTGCPTGMQLSCDSPDMFINYMDFSDDTCIRMFTEEQVIEVLSTLQNKRSDLINNGKCSEITTILKIKDATYLENERLIQTLFEGTDGEQAELYVYDLSGRLIINRIFSAFDINYIDAVDLAAGVYIIIVKIGVEVFEKKVIVY